MSSSRAICSESERWRAIDAYSSGSKAPMMSDSSKPCVTERKAALLAKYRRLDFSKVIIVKAEIESWYLAGLDADTCARLKLREVRDTQTVTKERFFQMMPGEFRSGLDFMVEVLKHHAIDVARAQTTTSPGSITCSEEVRGCRLPRST